jgi:hypothetical protein
MFHYLRVCQQPFYAPWDGTEFEEWTNGYLQIAKQCHFIGTTLERGYIIDNVRLSNNILTYLRVKHAWVVE